VIKVSVLYPNIDGKHFDMAYYCNRHIPLVREKLGSACKKVEVEQGLQGSQAGTRAPYIALTHLLFDSVDSFERAFGPHAETIQGDIPRYTNVEPVIQISQVKT